MLTRMRLGVGPRQGGLGLGGVWAQNTDGQSDVEDDDSDPHHGIWTSSPVLCEINTRDGWVFSHVLPSTGNKARSQEMIIGGYKREAVRSDGEAALVRS